MSVFFTDTDCEMSYTDAEALGMHVIGMPYTLKGQEYVYDFGRDFDAKKFYDEAKLVSRFNGNPNIISVYELFKENNTTYFVMEYLSGIDMKKYLKEK